MTDDLFVAIQARSEVMRLRCLAAQASLTGRDKESAGIIFNSAAADLRFSFDVKYDKIRLTSPVTADVETALTHGRILRRLAARAARGPLATAKKAVQKRRQAGGNV